MTAAEQTASLLARCELLLAASGSGSGLGCADEQAAASHNHRSSLADCVDSKVGAETGPSGYLEMLASPSSSKNSRECSREHNTYVQWYFHNSNPCCKHKGFDLQCLTTSFYKKYFVSKSIFFYNITFFDVNYLRKL